MSNAISVEVVAAKILLIRGKRVMLDKDLAKLYEVDTRQLTRQVRRNIERFPADFMFKLTKEEFQSLMCHFGTSSWGGTRKLPYVFTEQGVSMLSGVLQSKRAIHVNIQIMRAFTQLRGIILSNKDLRRKIEEMESKYDKQFVIVFQAIKQLLQPQPTKEKRITGFAPMANNKKSKNYLFQLIGVLLFFLAALQPAFSQTLLETEDFILSLHPYFRTDLVTFNNVVDLDNKNKDDSTVYLGIDYSLGFNLDMKNEGPKFYLKLERNGPYDYDAPLFVKNTLMTSGGVIESYQNEQLLPELEEFWMDTPVFNPFRFKLGLYTYIVGNGFSLNGGYENLGFTIYRECQDFCWRFYYCRPDLSHKYRLGPKIRQDKEQDILYEPNAANFFATDTRFKIGENYLQPYIGALVDYTSADKRNNLFSAPIKRDILGTIGLAWERKFNNLSWNLEAAHNFGKGESSDPDFKDVYHTGYLIYSGLEYKMPKITPSFQFLLCSGNKVTKDMALDQEETLSSAKNRAFSYHSPLNKNLGDALSSSNVDMLPIVAMGGGYGLNYGLPRPKTFSSGDFENLIMPCIGFDFQATEKLTIGLYEYYLSALEKGAGTFEGEAKYLSRDLGFETDVFIDYKINDNILLSLLGGYFSPGKFYKEKRDDIEGSLLSPFVRGDGFSHPAFQIELALEFKF